MENTARLYNCAHCHQQVTICSHCDRGNIYCGKSCAGLARRMLLRAAGKRYQNTRRGRLKHADRQRHYRSQGKKVTHQGSLEPPASDPLRTRSEPPEPVVASENNSIRCHFCGCLCSDYLRLDYLHRTTSLRDLDREIIHWPSTQRAQAP